MIMHLRKTSKHPNIYYANSEEDFFIGQETECAGLSAGYLNVKVLSKEQRIIWDNVFDLKWNHTCYLFATELKKIGIEFFTIVPCSRKRVMEGLREGFSSAGLTEVPNLINKLDAAVSYANKDREYIANNTSIGIEPRDLYKMSKIAICDDYSDSGKTLRGLYYKINSGLILNSNLELFLCSIGISRALANE